MKRVFVTYEAGGPLVSVQRRGRLRRYRRISPASVRRALKVAAAAISNKTN